VLRTRKPHLGQLDPGHGLARGLGQAGELLQGQADVLHQGQRTEKRTGLIGDAEAAQDAFAFAPPGGGHVAPLDEHLPAHGLVQADHVLEQGALAAARAPQDNQHLAPRGLEAHALQHGLAAVADAQVGYHDGGGVHHQPST